MKSVAFVVGLVAASGCRPESPGPTGTVAPTATGSASLIGTTAHTASGSAPRPDEHGPPEPVSLPMVAKVCASAPCSGDMAQVTVWRTKTGKVAVLEHQGDLGSCSHPPTVLFDTSAKELGTIPEKPVVPGSEEQKRLSAIRERHTHDMVGAEKIFCSAAKR